MSIKYFIPLILMLGLLACNEQEPTDKDTTTQSLQQEWLQKLASGQDVSALRAQFEATHSPTAGSGTTLNADHFAFDQQLEKFYRTFARLAAAPQFNVSHYAQAYSAVENLKASHLMLLEQYKIVEAQLVSANVDNRFEQRRQIAAGNQQQQFANLWQGIEPLVVKYGSAAESSLLDKDQQYLDQVQQLVKRVAEQKPVQAKQNEPRILRNNLPYRSPRPTLRKPVIAPVIKPSYSSVDNDQPPVGADLESTVDAPLSQEILKQAEILEYDYIRIYEFVRNEIQTQWYAGAMKGAQGALRQKSGNDIDQASLLIALFRASGLPSRYVHGVIELPIDYLQNNFALENVTQVTNLLSAAGVPFNPVVQGGKISAVNVEHTWVTAYVPYTNYRGAAVDRSGEIWLPLMPAIKNYNLDAPSGVLRKTVVNIDDLITAYLQTSQSVNLVDQLINKTEDFIQANPEQVPLAQQLGKKQIVAEKIGLIPNTLKVKTVAVTAEFAQLADSLRQRVRLIARNGVKDNSPILMDIILPVSEVASERLTISYLPATVADQQISNLFGGLEQVPAYLIKLRPQIKINGRKKAVAEAAMATGVPHRFDIEIISPLGTERVSQTLISGSYHAIAISAGGVARQLKDKDPADTEFLAAALLANVGYQYTDQWHQAENTIAAMLNTVLIRPLPSIVITSNELRVDSVLGQPQKLKWQAVTLDAGLRLTQVLARDISDDHAVRDTMRLSALQGSSYEHSVFEDLFLVKSISTDKGLQIAREQNIDVLQIDSGNVGTQLGLLQHPQNVIDNIEAWTQKGYDIEVPKTPISYQDWNGAVWRVEDKSSGAGGYFIAGGLAGGSTSQSASAWLLPWLADAMGSPNVPPPNSIPAQAASITKLEHTDGQTGVVGKPVEHALAVMVRDINGAPIKGAEVTFQVAAGGGLFNAGDVETVVTDHRGIASVAFTPGQKTGQNPVYVMQNTNDRHATKAGLNLVEAFLSNASYPIAIDQPFQVIAYPDAPIKLKAIAVSATGLIARYPMGMVTAQVYDAYENGVSNVAVEGSASGVERACLHYNYPVISGGHLYNSKRGAADSCTDPDLDNCGAPALTFYTDATGIAVGIIAGIGYKIHRITLNVAGLQPISDSFTTSHFLPGGLCPSAVAVGIRYSPIEVNEFGHTIQATLRGQKFSKPITAEAYTGDEKNGYKRDDAYSICWETNTEDSHIHPLSDTKGIAVAKIRATTSLSHFNTAYIVHPQESPINPDKLAFCKQGWNQTGGNGAIFHNEGAYGLKLQIDDPVALNVPSEVNANLIHVNANGLAEHPVQIKYNVFPNMDSEPTPNDGEVNKHYTSKTTEIDVFENDVLLDVKIGSTRVGPGEIIIPRGTAFDATKTYTAQLVLNRGTRFSEVRSELIPLPIQQGLIIAYDRWVHVSQDVDLLNQRTCNIGTEYNFEISEDAHISLEFIDETNPNVVTKLIDNLVYPKGKHKLSITPGDLLPKKYAFRLRATAVSNLRTESVLGQALVEYASTDNLPVGHTIVKGVDVADGNLSIVSADLSIPGRGAGLVFKRSYSSNHSSLPSSLGVGWQHNYNSRIVTTPCGEVIVIGAAGGGTRFVSDGKGGLKPLKGYHSSLVRNEQQRSFDFYAKDGTRYHYKNFGRKAWDLEFIQDTNGNVTRLGYDPSSRDIAKLITVEDDSGRRLEFSYENKHFTGSFAATDVITKVSTHFLSGGSQEADLSVVYSYDATGNLIKAVRENDTRSETYAYLSDATTPIYARHKIKSYTDPNGQRFNYAYQQTQRLVESASSATHSVPYAAITKVIEPESGATVFSYNTSLNETTVKNPKAIDNDYRLNQYGSVVSFKDPVGMTQTGWSANDVLVTDVINANNVRADFNYDANGNVLQEIVPAGNGTQLTKSYSYYLPSSFAAVAANVVKNRIKSKTDRNGQLTLYEYDAKGNLTRITDPNGGRTEYNYNDKGDKVSSKDPNGNITLFAYDKYGNLSKTTDALGNVTQIVWNARGLPVRQTDALGRVTSNAYDSLGRLLQTKNALNGVRKYSYDDNGNKLTETDEAGRTTSYTYDKENRITRVDNPLGKFKTLSYDNNGNKISERDWNGTVTSYEYDDNDRLIKQIDPEGRQLSFTYDALGNKLSETISDSLGTEQTTHYEYDKLNRIIKITDAALGITRFSYDGEGNKLSETDALGRVSDFEYDKLNRLIKTTDPLGGISRIEYDANGNKTAEVDAKAQRRTFTYDKLNRPIRVTDALGNEQVMAYDKLGNLTEEINARLHKTQHGYDKLNRRLVSRDALNYQTHYQYDSVGNLNKQTNPNGNEISHQYDKLNRLLSSSDVLGSLSTNKYDANGNVIEQTDANAQLTSNVYDRLNRLTGQTLPANRSISMTYDVFGNKRSQTDANNHTSSFSYDPLNRLLTETDALGQIKSYSYDAVGNKLSEIDKRNNSTLFTYDKLNRMSSSTDALNQKISISYDAVGNKLSETDKRSIKSTYSYDAANRLLSTHKNHIVLLRTEYDEVGNKIFETDGLANKTAYIYDKRNQLIEQSRPLAAINRFKYDAMGNQTENRDPEGRITQQTYDLRQRLTSQTNGENETEVFAYDGNGNRTSLQRPNNNIWTYTYDGADRLTSIADALTGTTAYSYDNNGNRLTQTDANNNITAYEYDALNRRTLITYADTNTTSFSYDENSNMTGMTGANALSFTFVFDELNRETEKKYPTATNPTGDDIQTIVNQYDENNNLTSITETYSGITGALTTEQRFDNFDRLTQKTDAQGKTIRYSYDANGNRKTVKDPDGLVTTYNYDALNRVSAVVNSQGITNYKYDRSSLKTEVNYPNSTKTKQNYDNAIRVTNISNTQNNAVVSSYAYTYDNNGNRIEQVETNGGAAETTSYTYDANDRLTEEAGPNKTAVYTHDGAYNRLTEVTTENTGNTETVNKTYDYNNRNQVTTVTDNLEAASTATYTYDANGNRLSKTQNSIVTTFNYDVRDQLREILSGGSSVGQFLYDYQGLRIRKATQTETLRYVYDNQSVLVQTDDAGTTLSKYDYGPDRLLSLNNTTEGAQFYLFDALGSVVDLTKPDGSIQTRIQYDAWGNVRNQVGSSANEFGFTGHEMDRETDLIYMKARFYDPSLGLFLNQDAYQGEVDTPPSLHKYLYAYANPTVYVDLDGHVSVFGQASQRLQVLKDWLVEQNKAADSSGAAIAIGTSQFVTTLGQGVTGGLDIAANVAQEALGVDSSQVRNELAATRKAVSKAIDFVVNGDYAKAVKNVHQAAVRETVKAMEGDVTATANVTQGVLGLSLLKPMRSGKGRRLLEHHSSPSTLIQSEVASFKQIRENVLQLKGLHEKIYRKVGKTNFSINKNLEKSVVLGEGMADIKAVAMRLQAKGLDAKWYQAWGKNFPKNRPMNLNELTAALKRNELWIKTKIKEGYSLYDIGIDSTRSIRSPFYKLEKNVIKEKGVKVIKLDRIN